MTDSHLKRSVLITGAGKPGNLAHALLQAFADRGDTIYAVGRKLSDVEASLSEVRQQGAMAHAFAAELTDEAEIERLMGEVGALTNGRLDALVHAAGKFIPFGAVADGSLDTWQSAFANNATSAFLTTRGSLPMLRTAQGAIVYIASVVAMDQGGVAPAGMADYAAAKAAVVQLMRAVADEERGVVRANVIAPGGIKTEAMLAAIGDAPGMVTPQEVAAKVIHLAGPASGDATGTVLLMG